VDKNFVVLDRRAGRITETKELEKALENLYLQDVEIFFKASTEHRGAVVLRGERLSDQITDADPHRIGVKIVKAQPKINNESARKTARIVNELVQQSYDILSNLPLNREREAKGKPPANILLLRGAAVKPRIPSIEELYGVKGIGIAAGALYIGIAKLMGLETKRAEGTTGGANSKIINKARLAVRELEKGKDFAFIHLKGADSCAHDHNAEAKIAYIEKADKVIGYLLDNLDWNETHLAFTGDHTTPIVYGDHVSDPVPLVFVGPNVIPDEVKEFNERSVLRGGLGRISGRVIPILFGYCDWLKKFGT
jgi:2,3-bisphosphoglycerate-independent phosphoglycerate mutase